MLQMRKSDWTSPNRLPLLPTQYGNTIATEHSSRVHDLVSLIEKISVPCQVCPVTILHLSDMHAVHPDRHYMESAKSGCKLAVACCHFVQLLCHP